MSGNVLTRELRDNGVTGLPDLLALGRDVGILARVVGTESGTFAYHRAAELPAPTEIGPHNHGRTVIHARSQTDELGRLRSLLLDTRTSPKPNPDIDRDADTLSDPEVFAAALAPGQSILGQLERRPGAEQVPLRPIVIGMPAHGLVIAGDASPKLTGVR